MVAGLVGWVTTQFYSVLQSHSVPVGWGITLADWYTSARYQHSPLRYTKHFFLFQPSGFQNLSLGFFPCFICWRVFTPLAEFISLADDPILTGWPWHLWLYKLGHSDSRGYIISSNSHNSFCNWKTEYCMPHAFFKSVCIVKFHDMNTIFPLAPMS